MARNMNTDSPLCFDISANFSNIDHLLECKYRHYFTSEMIPTVPKFVENIQCLVEILHVASPVWFEVRIHKYKDSSNGSWCSWNSSEQFDDFSDKLNQFHTKSFCSVENILDADKNILYVLRKGHKFMRCKILDIK